MVHSTIWVDRAARDVFLTALLLARPQEFSEPIQTYKTDSTEPTDFILPPGWYGYVPASGVGIVRLSNTEEREGVEALKRLAGADPDSRSQDFDGRRMVRVDGGYIVINYMKYWDRDYTAAERMKRYRERKKKASVISGNGDALQPDVTRNVTHGDGEVRSEKEEVPKSKTSSKPSASQGEPTLQSKIQHKFTELYMHKNSCSRSEVPWDSSTAGKLARFIKQHPNWPEAMWMSCLENRFRSEVNHAESFEAFLPRIVEYRNSPLDKFKKPLSGKPSESADDYAYTKKLLEKA